MIRSPNPADPVIAAAVSALPAAEAEGKLHSWLRHPDAAERERVVAALRADGSLRVAQFAAKRTSKSGAVVEREAVMLLAWLMEAGSPSARSDALSALGLLATSGKDGPLIDRARAAVEAEVARRPDGLVALSRRHEVGSRLFAAGALDPALAGAMRNALILLAGDANTAVRLKARERLGALAPDDLFSAVFRLAERLPGPAGQRAEAWGLLASRRPGGVARLVELAERDAETLSTVLSGFADAAPAELLPVARRALASDELARRQRGARVLANAADPADRAVLTGLTSDDQESLRAEGVRAATHWADAEGAAITLVGAFASRSESSFATACVKDLRQSAAMRWLAEQGVAFEFQEDEAARRKRLLREGVVRDAVLGQLDRLLGSRVPALQGQAFDCLALLDGDDADARVALVLSRGPVSQRPRALHELVRRHGAAALLEVVSALADKTDSVAEAARELLGADDSPFAELHLPNGAKAVDAEKAVQRLIAWGEAAGRAFLRTPTRVQGWLGGAGRTRQQGRGEQGITIDINFDPLLRASEHAVDVIRGVIVHELGHHKYDFRVPGFRAAAGVVKAKKAFRVFNVLLDERLERQLRRDRPEWAIYVDRMNAWLMQGEPMSLPLAVYADAVEDPNVDARIDAGELPGRRVGDVVRLGPWDALGVPGLVPPLHAFLLGVFVVRDPSQVADPQARAALELLPKDLAATRHGPLAALSVQITDLLDCHDGGEEQDARWRELVGRHGGMLGELAAVLDRNADVHTLANWASGDRTGEDGGWEPGPPLREADVTVTRSKKLQRGSGRMGTALQINVSEELDFEELEERWLDEVDASRTVALRREVRPQVRRLRAHFERLGTALVETPASRRGRRLDLAQVRDFAATRRPNVLVNVEERVRPDAYVGLVIDRSGSMSVGERMPLARRFAMLLADSAGGLPGIEGHVSAFDHRFFHRLGDFRRNTIAALEPGGGNNDAGGLQAAANLALASRKSNRLLIMISDGLPTECSVDSLRQLVRRLRTDHDVRCAQVAVAPLQEVCFPEFLDVSSVPPAEAIRRFGRLLERLTRGWS